MSVSVTLFIPELIQPLAAWKRDFGFSPETPVFSSLLDHSHVDKTSASGFERCLFSSLGFSDNEELPIARYRLECSLAEQSMMAQQFHDSQQTLLCADPVHCEAGMNDVTLTQAVKDLGKTETDELIALLNRHFGEDGLRFFAANNSQWYLQLPEKETLKTTVLADVLGKNIFPCLPTSRNRNWLALQNEVQMLLHCAKINQTREIAGQASVNSLWFWGGGDVFKPNQRFEHVFARENCSEAQVFARASNIQCSELSSRQIQQLAAEKTASHVAIILDQLIAPAQATDLDAWQATLNRLEQDYIEPLQTLWKNGQLDLRINTANGKILTPLKKTRWKFWQQSSVNLLDFCSA